ncbi:MAG: sulfotransferase [Cyanobacteriota bacterium]|nr:sulfotransferase [Cyanobacteriota bacterium]
MTSAQLLKAIFGAGRSGTTLLGSILSTHPDIAYRFEPFHRIGKHNSTINHYQKASQEIALSEEKLLTIYNLLLQADPLTDKPPFFPKAENRHLPSQKLIWLLGKSLPVLTPLYKLLYTPQKSPPLVFKEVNLENLMLKFIQQTSVPVVYLARHPCATILSQFKGQSQKKMPVYRQGILLSLLQKHDPSLADYYGSHLENMTEIEKTALLWRIDLEKAVAAINNSQSQGLLVFYEQICEDPHKYIQAIFKHFNLTYPEPTKNFLDFLCSIDSESNSSKKFNNDWMNSYFTVYRNPHKQKDLWKTKILPEQRKEIEAIVNESWMFELCASQAKWD